MQSMRHESAFSFGALEYLSLHSLHRRHCIGLQDQSKDRSGFFSSASASGKFVRNHAKFAPQSPKSCTRKSEEATRQQGGLFFRENSSNGGKAIRTFWRNTKFGKIPCQG